MCLLFEQKKKEKQTKRAFLLYFQFYNANESAIGYYVRTEDDVMFFRLRHFDFQGFETSEEGIHINGYSNEIQNLFVRNIQLFNYFRYFGRIFLSSLSLIVRYSFWVSKKPK